MDDTTSLVHLVIRPTILKQIALPPPLNSRDQKPSSNGRHHCRSLRSPRRRLLLLLPRPRPLSTSPNPNPTPNPSPNPKPLSALHSAIKSEPNPDRIAGLLESSSHLPRFYSDRPLHTLALCGLSRLRLPDLIRRVLRSQIFDPKSPKYEGFFTRILFHYASSGLLDDAVRLFHQIPNCTELSFCALLTALLTDRKYDLAIEKFETLPKSIGIEPDIVAYILYLKALCIKGDMETVLLNEMVKSKGLTPDIICYNVALYGYMKSGDGDGFAGEGRGQHNLFKGSESQVITKWMGLVVLFIWFGMIIMP